MFSLCLSFLPLGALAAGNTAANDGLTVTDVTEDLTDGQRKNNLRLQEDLKARYYNAPDLEWVGKNGWRFVNAVSDFATHADPIRKTRNYNENLFLRTAEGNPMIDKAYKMVLAAA